MDPDYIKYNRLLVEHKTDALALDRNTFVWRDGKNLILATKGNYRPKAEIRLGGYKISPNPLEGVEFPTRVISHDQYTKIKDSCKKID